MSLGFLSFLASPAFVLPWYGIGVLAGTGGPGEGGDLTCRPLRQGGFDPGPRLHSANERRDHDVDGGMEEDGHAFSV
jgi:hypothetical protein